MSFYFRELTPEEAVPALVCACGARFAGPQAEAQYQGHVAAIVEGGGEPKAHYIADRRMVVRKGVVALYSTEGLVVLETGPIVGPAGETPEVLPSATPAAERNGHPGFTNTEGTNGE